LNAWTCLVSVARATVASQTASAFASVPPADVASTSVARPTTKRTRKDYGAFPQAVQAASLIARARLSAKNFKTHPTGPSRIFWLTLALVVLTLALVAMAGVLIWLTTRL